MKFKFSQLLMNKRLFLIAITSIYIFSFSFAGQPPPGGCPGSNPDSNGNGIIDTLERDLQLKFKPTYHFFTSDYAYNVSTKDYKGFCPYMAYPSNCEFNASHFVDGIYVVYSQITPIELSELGSKQFLRDCKSSEYTNRPSVCSSGKYVFANCAPKDVAEIASWKCFEIKYHNVYTHDKAIDDKGHIGDREGQSFLVCSNLHDNPDGADADVYPDIYTKYGMYATILNQHHGGDAFCYDIAGDSYGNWNGEFYDSIDGNKDVYIADGKHASYLKPAPSTTDKQCPRDDNRRDCFWQDLLDIFGVCDEIDKCCATNDESCTVLDHDQYVNQMVDECYNVGSSYWQAGKMTGVGDPQDGDYLVWKTSRLNFKKFQEYGCCIGTSKPESIECLRPMTNYTDPCL